MTDLEKLKSEFLEAYEALKSASKKYGEASLALHKAKREYDSEKGKLLTSGSLDGKNAETREVQASQLLLAQNIRLAECEDSFSKAKSDFALASLRKEELEVYLKIAELEVK